MKNQREYRARINRVMDYIEEHVEESLTLEELASVACFSKFHFARIFLFCTGETLFQFIQRIRLERAAYFLCASRVKQINNNRNCTSGRFFRIRSLCPGIPQLLWSVCQQLQGETHTVSGSQFG